MYESYFGFSEAPFENNLDLRFLFLNEDNKEVLSALLYFIKTKKAFGIVSGDVGTGKTMIISTFLSKLPKSVQPIIISNPYVNSLELLQFIAKCLKLRISAESVLELTDKVKNALIKGKERQKQYVLIVDEAHLLSDQSLEEIRLLSNIETSDQKLLQILLFGQYELSHKLDRPEMRHIRQRINVNRFLSPLNLSETIGYIEHRLKTVGSSFDSCFEDNCGRFIFKMTKGVPRHINQLCDNALLICMAQQTKKVNRKILKMAEEAWQTDRIFTPKSLRGKSSFKHGLVPLTGTMMIILAGGALLSYSGFLGARAQQISQGFLPASWSTGDKKISSRFEFSKGGQPLAARKQPEPDFKPSATNPLPPKTAVNEFQKGDRDSTGITPEVPEDQQSDKSARVSGDGGAPASTEIPGQETAKQNPAPVEVKFPSENLPGTSAGAAAPASDKPAETEARLSPHTPPMELPDPRKHQPAELKSPETSQPPTQIVAKKGDNLTAIANKNYPGNGQIGLSGIILANPNINHDNLIYPGQVLELPKINFTEKTIQLKDNRFYSLYAHYYSPKDLINGTAWLAKAKVKFLVLSAKDRQGKTLNRIFFGGYEKVDELKDAIKRTEKR